MLVVLARSESAFGASQVARLTERGSRSGTTKVLDRLVEHGLVLAEPTNRGYMYRLNRDHLLMPAVFAALDVRRDLLTRLSSAVAALRPTPVHASVFGSFARGDGSQESDIDLLVLTDANLHLDDDSGWQAQVRQLEDHVYAWTGNRLELLSMDTDGLAKAIAAGERIVEELRSDAVTVHGHDIRTLISAARAGEGHG
ncbi:nucleotidyltransferase domain-containing protein [Aeromicrobium chenweiae]|uniref:nucleotidyltransferase domain-containing protein n=1 Tax=Aeromicrobium chenweiae TaxID=2079793 RepID=UPI00131F3FCF|nr:nucleotidyltransferase domain-containing protein [Aeromicrobium chenweiae]